VRLRQDFLCAVTIAAGLAVTSPTRTTALVRSGITPVPCPDQSWQYGDATFEALPGARAFFGRNDGGLYRLEIPEKWNGELVLFAHGFVAAQGQSGSILRVGTHSIREHVISEGFAWAASSYRCNGYVPGIGLQDTMALVDLFTKSNGGRAPQRTYLTGVSMGGHITILGLHQLPTAFAGGLAMCPAGPELFDFYTAVGAAAEVITGVQFTSESVQQDLATMAELLGKPPDYTEKGRQLASVEINISGGPRPFAVEGLASGGRFTANISGGALAGVLTPQNRAVTNTHVKYVIDSGLGLTADALNQRARRKPADAKYRGSNAPYEEVAPFDGRIERPLLTLHGTGDLFVPIFLQQTLKRAVVSAGNENRLVQRVYRIAGHCGFSQPEQIKAFDDLVKWVRQGIRPEGDEVLGDLSNAGMTFTNPLRPNDPGGLAIKPPLSSSPQARIDFARDVQPIFKQHCYGCHGPTQQMNGFRLDRRRDAMRGGTIPVIGPGASEASRLYLRLIGAQFGLQMPPTGPLDADQVRIIKDWIDQGADWPDEFSGDAPAPPPDPRATRLIDALRRGDRHAFTAAVAADPGAATLKGADGSTPLMYAALYRDADAVRLLLERGADPNARNDAGATALMWAVEDEAATKLLLDHGADANAISDVGRTPLMHAAGRHGAAPIVKLLLEHGANPSPKAARLNRDTTPLVEAASAGDPATIQLLLDHRADISTSGSVALAFALRAQCAECVELLAKRMERNAVSRALLTAIPPVADGRAVTLLLDRGADATIADGLGRTVLMRAAASEAVPLDVVKALIDRGADVNAKSSRGDTALAFARRQGATPLVDFLLKAGAHDEPTATVAVKPPTPAGSARSAVSRSLPLLQQSDVSFLRRSGCVSCHNNSLTAMAVSLARQNGLPVDEEIARRQLRTIGEYIDGWRDRLRQGMGIPGDVDTVSYILLGLAAERYAPDEATDAMARFIRNLQSPTGQWRIISHRPPIESSDIEVTAASMRALQVYGPQTARAEYQAAVARAAAWILAAQPKTSEDRAFQLLGLAWAGAGRSAIQPAARALAAEQRADGGWAQIPSLASDAYATGQALVALEASGALTPNDVVFKRGIQFLLSTQLADGSWFVKSRAIAIQPHLESGFPHERDQFISAAATNWATMALALAARRRS
jgi:ankyrin repeat protein